MTQYSRHGQSAARHRFHADWSVTTTRILGVNVIGDPSVDRETVGNETLSTGIDDGVHISERPLHNFYRIAHECACRIKEGALLQPAAAFDHASVMQPEYQRMGGSRRLTGGGPSQSHSLSICSVVGELSSVRT